MLVLPVEVVRVIVRVVPFVFCNVTLPPEDVESALNTALPAGKRPIFIVIPEGSVWTPPSLTKAPPPLSRWTT